MLPRTPVRGWATLLAVVVALLASGMSPTRASSAPPTPGPLGWSPVPPSDRTNPWQRYDAALADDDVGGVGVLFGGIGPNGTYLDDSWVNDGDFVGGWSNVTDDLARSPPPLAGAAEVYDASDGVYLLFGGRLANGSPYGGTWELAHLDDWSEVETPVAPPAEWGASLAYDPTDGVAVLVSSVGNGTTWAFHAGAWHPVAATLGPPTRSGAAFVDDPSLGSDVLFGGTSAGGPRNDTWEFAHDAWHSVPTVVAPPASGNLAAAYDERAGDLLLFEGAGPTTWELASGGWSRVAGPTPGGPTARTGASLYFDDGAGYPILFGGLGSDGSTVETGAWGWAIPPVPVDPTVTPSPFSAAEGAAVVLLVVAPVALAAYLRRRPPRRAEVTVPSPVGSQGT